MQRMIQSLLIHAYRFYTLGNKPFAGFASQTGGVTEIFLIVSPIFIPAGVNNNDIEK